MGSPQSLRNSQLVQDLCTQTSLVHCRLIVCSGEKTGSRKEGSTSNQKKKTRRRRHQHESCLHMICNTCELHSCSDVLFLVPRSGQHPNAPKHVTVAPVQNSTLHFRPLFLNPFVHYTYICHMSELSHSFHS